MRAPTSSAWNATSQNGLSAIALDSHLSWLRTKLYNLFTNYPGYNSFSNKGWTNATSNASSYDSIEAIHDQIHTDVGQGGHMTYTPTSAFDPVFFLHHCFVDRLFTWWQELYPNSWIVPAAATSNTYTIATGDILTAKTPLTPFYADTDGDFWDSDMSRDTNAFGYSYDETVGPTTKTARYQRQEQLRAKINRIYGSSSPLGMASRHRRGRNGPREQTLPDKAIFRAGDTPDLSRHSGLNDMPIPPIVKDNHYTEWIANIRVMMHCLGSPFSIHLFLGGVPVDASSWTTARNLVGSMSVFGPPQRMAEDKFVSSTVPLTTALMKMMALGVISSLDSVAEIQSFLEQHLHVRVSTAMGNEVDLDQAAGLCVKIASAAVKAPTTETEFPKWEQAVTRFRLV